MRGISLILLFLLPCGVFAQQLDNHNDESFRDSIVAMLERDLNWPRQCYEIEVNGSVAIVKIKEDFERRQKDAGEKLQHIDGLQVQFVDAAASDGQGGFWSGVGEHAARRLGVAGESVSFPTGDVFQPIVADEKQPQFRMSMRRYDSATLGTTVGAVAYGESFGLLRVAGQGTGDGVQFGLSGALFAQFDLESASNDLVNADYTAGGYMTVRRGVNSYRVRYYHQSSHLGDEFLLRQQHPDRINLSYEAMEVLGSRDWGPWRGYLGGEYIARRDPETLKPGGLHGGVEYRSADYLVGSGRFVGGVDLKSYQENDWYTDTSVKLGLEFGRPGPGGRKLRLMGEGYTGYSPHGQFYSQKVRYLGAGLYLGF